MPRIEDEGTHKVKIAKAAIIEHRFRQNKDPNTQHYDKYALEIRLTGIDAQNRTADLYLPITMDYIQKGNDAGRTECEVTFDKLAALGIGAGGKDLSMLPKLVGREVEFYGKRNQKGDMYWYLNLREEVEVNPAEAARRMRLMMEGESPAQAKQTHMPQAVQQQCAVDDIPF